MWNKKSLEQLEAKKKRKEKEKEDCRGAGGD